MKVLLDTNIVIYRESTVADPDIGTLFRWLDNLHYEKCLHQVTIDEIEKHKDSLHVKKMNIKLESYNVLKTQAPMSREVSNLSLKMDRDDNDRNDSILINELFCNRIDIFITEDKNIHFKASMLKLSDRVFTISSFLEKAATENPTLISYKILSVKKEYFGNIDVNQSFFDSFREDYTEFNKWFANKSDKTAYVCMSGKEIVAFLYVKPEGQDENYSDISPVFQKKKRLKIGTLKVTATGMKIGERFLKIIFDNALEYKVKEIYVTIFRKRAGQEMLITLLEEWGFYKHGTKTSINGEEEVYVRDFTRKVDNTNPKKTFPYLSVNNNIFIASIYPEYHTSLLPDSILRTESPNDFIENEPFRNAISKVYVSHSKERNLKSGDLIVFYRTGGIYRGVATTIGIVDSIVDNIADEEQFKNLCRNRSVLTDEELSSQWNRFGSYKPFIVNFLYAVSFDKKIILKKLLEMGVIKEFSDLHKGFVKINKQAFMNIIKEAEVDENIIIN